MPEKKKPLITRERYRAYLQKNEKPHKNTEEPKKQREPVNTNTSRRARVEEPKDKALGDKWGSVSTAWKRKPRTTVKRHSDGQKSRLSAKEKGRRLDKFYNWAILLVLIAIILVFVLAFVI